MSLMTRGLIKIILFIGIIVTILQTPMVVAISALGPPPITSTTVNGNVTTTYITSGTVTTTIIESPLPHNAPSITLTLPDLPKTTISSVTDNTTYITKVYSYVDWITEITTIIAPFSTYMTFAYGDAEHDVYTIINPTESYYAWGYAVDWGRVAPGTSAYTVELYEETTTSNNTRIEYSYDPDWIAYTTIVNSGAATTVTTTVSTTVHASTTIETTETLSTTSTLQTTKTTIYTITTTNTGMVVNTVTVTTTKTTITTETLSDTSISTSVITNTSTETTPGPPTTIATTYYVTTSIITTVSIITLTKIITLYPTTVLVETTIYTTSNTIIIVSPTAPDSVKTVAGKIFGVIYYIVLALLFAYFLARTGQAALTGDWDSWKQHVKWFVIAIIIMILLPKILDWIVGS